MRTLTICILFFLSFVLLFGCNVFNSKGNDHSSNEHFEKPPRITEHPFELENLGDFYRYKKKENVGVYETGPISIEIELAETLKGSMTEELKSSKEYQDMELISVLMKFDLNRKLDEMNNDLKFSSKKNIHIVTDTGEEIIQSDSLLSSVVDLGILKTTHETDESPFLRHFMFQLKDATAQEIEKANLLIDAPVDSEGNKVGEDLEIEIDFTKDNSF